MRITVDIPDTVAKLAREALLRGRLMNITVQGPGPNGGDPVVTQTNEEPELDELVEDFLASVAQGEQARRAGEEVQREMSEHRAARRSKK